MSADRAVLRPAPYGQVLVTGALFGVLLVVPALLIYGIARLLGVPFAMDGPIGFVGVGQVLLTPVVAGVAGAALAGTFRTLVHGPRVAAVVLGALTVASCASPVVLAQSAATAVVLVLLHLIVGGGLTWALSRAITSEDPPPGRVADIDSRHPGTAAITG